MFADDPVPPRFRRPPETLWNRYGAKRGRRWNTWPCDISVTVGADLNKIGGGGPAKKKGCKEWEKNCEVVSVAFSRESSQKGET